MAQIMRLLVATLLGGAGFELGQRALPGGSPFPGFGDGGGGIFGGLLGGKAPRRRRRRKALTDDDVALMLTISSSSGKKAAETFIARRVRSS